MVINTNTAAARGARYLGESSGNLQKSLARLSSGSKIVEPQDDAAGMAVASRMDAQINRTESTRSNIGNAISFKQTQDGYLAKAAKALEKDQSKEQAGRLILALRIGIANVIMPNIPPVKR